VVVVAAISSNASMPSQAIWQLTVRNQLRSNY